LVLFFKKEPLPFITLAGLHNVQPGRGAGEILFGGDRDEILKLSQTPWRGTQQTMCLILAE